MTALRWIATRAALAAGLILTLSLVQGGVL